MVEDCLYSWASWRKAENHASIFFWDSIFQEELAAYKQFAMKGGWWFWMLTLTTPTLRSCKPLGWLWIELLSFACCAARLLVWCSYFVSDERRHAANLQYCKCKSMWHLVPNTWKQLKTNFSTFWKESMFVILCKEVWLLRSIKSHLIALRTMENVTLSSSTSFTSSASRCTLFNEYLIAYAFSCFFLFWVRTDFSNVYCFPTY